MGKIARSTLVLLVMLSLVAACGRKSHETDLKNMSQLTPRLKPVFEKTKTVCFGRFLVDVPQSAEVVWGETLVPLGVKVFPNGVKHVEQMAQKFIGELRSEKAIYKNHVPLLVSIEEVNQPVGKLVVGYEGFDAIDEFKINGYFEIENAGVVVDARPLGEGRSETVALIKSIARRVRHSNQDEVPTEPGNCIEFAFLPDLPNTKEDDLLEHISIGIRLKEIPDAHFSIYVAPSNPHNPEGDSLETQFKRTFADMTSPEEKKVLANTKIFRQRSRQIHDWKTGFEILMRSPDEDGSLSHHDFRMKFVGVPHDVFKPYADIQFQSGVGDNAAGQIKATLTDDEALAIWDKITSTIRVRPTSAARDKTADADASARRPLGELAATGRVCPQTGTWEPNDTTEGIQGRKRRYIHAGENMPHVMLNGEPSLWQKLKGERPTYRSATLWKLVAYDDASAEKINVVQVPDIAQPPEALAAKSNSDDAKSDTHDNLTPPKSKG